MILFVFEGKKREPDLFRSLQKLFFPRENEQIVCSFGNNLYQLYKDLKEYGDDGDVVSVLMEKFEGEENNPFSGVERSSDFSEIFLFFDYDFHNANLPLEEINKQVREMLSVFNDETDKGKLYINYPMIESIRYTKELPDLFYYTYIIEREQCGCFKGLAADFSFYRSLDFIQIDKRKIPSEEEMEKLKNNWMYLKEQNVSKANYICSGVNSIPLCKDVISQDKIFDKQLEKYVWQNPCRVSVLNAFPLFLYEYFVRL